MNIDRRFKLFFNIAFKVKNQPFNKPPAEPFRDTVIRTCLELIENKMKPSDAVQYAVARGNRKFMWDVLCDYVEENVLKKGKSRA